MNDEQYHAYMEKLTDQVSNIFMGLPLEDVAWVCAVILSNALDALPEEKRLALRGRVFEFINAMYDDDEDDDNVVQLKKR